MNNSIPESLSAIELSFARNAEEYCVLLEDPQPLNTRRKVKECARVLAALYSLASDASLDDPQTYVLVPEPSGLEVGSALVESRVSEQLGSRNLYWEAFDPYDETSLLSTTLSDDLRDIYRDIVIGLALIRSSTKHDRKTGFRSLIESFRAHWGDHLVDALRVLHRLRYEESADDL